MLLIAVGLNHRTTPVELREKLTLTEQRLPGALGAVLARPEIAEAVIVSTCNRAELYAVIDDMAKPESSPDLPLEAILASWGGVPSNALSGHLYHYRDQRAAEHAFRVASGLDSMILGDGQILGQVKTAYEVARTHGATGAILNTLFQSALATGKAVRTQTGIGQGAFSIGSAAVELATRIFGDTLAGKTVLVLGAGKMSELTARHLQSCGAPAVLVTNRTFERAQALADQLGAGASARRFDDLGPALLTSDIVICSTAAPHPIVTRDLIQTAMRARRNRPLFLIDIAVPRDVDPEVGDLQNVYLYNIDDLSAVVARDQAARHAESRLAGAIIDAAVAQFGQWRRGMEVTPLVTAVRERLDSLRLDEIARVRARLPHLSDHEMRVIGIALQSMSGKIAHEAIAAIKDSANTEPDNSYQRLDAIRSAFGLSTENNAPLMEPSQAANTSLKPQPATDNA